MIGFYNYTVVLTYLSFASALFGIVNTFKGNVFISVICLLFSGLCDMFDGRVARTKKDRTKEERLFGMELDSLADVVCFGVFPAIIGYAIGMNKLIFFPILIFYSTAALIRLAYFNVLEISRDNSEPIKSYTGLPVTSAALIFPFIYIFRRISRRYFPIIYAVIMLVVGILFISKIRVKKPTLKTMILFIILGIIEILSMLLWFKLL